MSILPGLLAALVVISGVSPAAGSSEPGGSVAPVVVVEYRLPDADASLAASPVDRTSLLFGRVDFRARPLHRDLFEVRELAVGSAVSRVGSLCRSTAEAPDTCRYDFGRDLRRRELIFRTRVVDRFSGESFEVEQQVSTLRTEPGGGGKPGAASPTEHVATASHPPDYVTRAVRVSHLNGRGADRHRVPVLDLSAGDFSAAARGLGPVEIASVRSPDPDRACNVVVAWSVASHLEIRNRSLVWSASHAPLVHQIRRGLESAARRGFDCGWFVVEYVETPRPLYGPFRLHTGEALDERQSAANQEVLDGLVRHLLADPPDGWGRLSSSGRRPAWISDFLSVYNTLNDLLRGFEGLTEVLVLTDGRDFPTTREPTFRLNLWPSRIDALNRAWSDTRVERLLAELDSATTALDRKLSAYVSTLDPTDPELERKIARERARIDPGGLASLQAHRRDLWPNVDILLLPSESQYEEDLDRYLPFRHCRMWRMITKPGTHPGEVLPAPGAAEGDRTFTEALLELQHLIRTSYLVGMVIPNPRQDRKAHELRIEARGPTARESGKLEVEFMPAYLSSPPLAAKMPVYATSPFKQLRLLAAYTFREHAFDEAHFDLLERILSVEQDPQIRRVLFESWISVQFQRLQAGPAEVSGKRKLRRYVETAGAELRALDPVMAPDPRLAAEARAVATARSLTREP